MEFFYNNFIVNSVLNIGGQTTKVLDKGSIELVGPFGMWGLLIRISKIISTLSKGIVTSYALFIVISICFYLFIFIFMTILFDLFNSIIVSILIILFLISNYKDSLGGCSGFAAGEKYVNDEWESLSSSVLFTLKGFGLKKTFSTTPICLAKNDPKDYWTPLDH